MATVLKPITVERNLEDVDFEVVTCFIEYDKKYLVFLPTETIFLKIVFNAQSPV